MNWDVISGSWKEWKGSIREKWGKITDSDFESIAGKKDLLVGKIQQAYGLKKEEIEGDIDKWIAEMGKKKENKNEDKTKKEELH